MPKFCCLSDIHGNVNILSYVGQAAKREQVDAVLIAGDICSTSRYNEFVYLLRHLSDHAKAPVLLTLGNHDFLNPEKVFKADDRPYPEMRGAPEYNFWGLKKRKSMDDDGETIREWSYGVVCLFDEAITFKGLKIYGTPWVRWLEGKWNYEVPIKDLSYEHIPEDTDILLTHQCPFGYGDRMSTGLHVGSEALTQALHMRPGIKLHCYKHFIVFLEEANCSRI